MHQIPVHNTARRLVCVLCALATAGVRPILAQPGAALASVPANPFTGTYIGSYRTIHGPHAGQGGTITLHVMSDGTATMLAANGQGPQGSAAGATSTTGVFAVNSTINGIVAISGRLTISGGTVLGSAQYASGNGDVATITLMKLVANSPFAGTYTGTYRATQGQEVGSTGTVALHVNIDGTATFTAHGVFVSVVNSDGSFTFSNRDSSGRVSTISGRLTGSGSAMTGAGTFQSSDGSGGTFALHKA